jgi:hypothetical protein
MILAAADYALGKKDAVPPLELTDYFKCELFSSLPSGKGWKNEPYRWTQRVTVFTNVYNAVKRHGEAKNLKGKEKQKWNRENKSTLSIILRIEKLRGANNG